MATFDENLRKIRGEAIYGPDLREAIAEGITQAGGDILVKIDQYKTEVTNTTNQYKNDVTSAVNQYKTNVTSAVNQYKTDVTSAVNQYKTDVNNVAMII